jgi:TfoX/Sxy family transcriptional regulator of competence genes
MAFDETLAVKLRQALGKRSGLSEKKMFGGVGHLLSGNMVCGVWKDFLILRLAEEVASEVLQEEDVRPFDITGKPMKGWAMAGPAGWRQPANLKRWVGLALDFAESLPPKD